MKPSVIESSSSVGLLVESLMPIKKAVKCESFSDPSIFSNANDSPIDLCILQVDMYLSRKTSIIMQLLGISFVPSFFFL